MNLVFQLDRELLRLQGAIKDATFSDEPVDKENLQLRLDILYSRVDLLLNSNLVLGAVPQEQLQTLLIQISNVNTFVADAIKGTAIDHHALGAALSSLNELEPAAQALSFETSNRLTRKLEQQRETVLKDIDIIIVLSAAQMIMLGFGFALFIKRQFQLRILNEKLELRVREWSAAKAEAESANQSKSRFLAAASHDLRQPTAALALYTGMLTTAVNPGNASLVSNMQRCVDSMTHLVNDLLAVSKLDAGVVMASMCDFAMEELYESLLANYGATAAAKGLHLRFRHAHNITLHTDIQLFKRVLGNLVDNALKFTTQGGVLIATRQHLGHLWIEVWDTGPGIPQEELSLVFEEFHKLGNSTQAQGSGLGLTIVARISALLGLQIRMRSRPGRGSMFAIELPVSSTVFSVQ